MTDYELEIGLYHQDNQKYAVELRFRQPEDEADPSPVRGQMEIDFKKLRQAAIYPKSYGKHLSQFLFADQSIRQTFLNAWAATVTKDEPLRIRLYVDRRVPELHNVRWETLLHPDDGTWLATSQHVLFSRY
jgi:hypothetical protein